MSTEAKIKELLRLIDSGEAKTQTSKVVAFLKVKGQANTLEIAQHLKVKVNTAAARITRLRELGLVVEFASQKVNGTNYTKWIFIENEELRKHYAKQYRVSRAQKRMKGLIENYADILSDGFLRRMQTELASMS